MEEAEVAKGGQRPDSFLKDTGTRMAEGHIRHCFDYIRQALMCGADTNLEVLDRETRATSGWGQNRQCRDYYEVVEWAEKWANSTETGILTKGTIPQKHWIRDNGQFSWHTTFIEFSFQEPRLNNNSINLKWQFDSFSHVDTIIWERLKVGAYSAEKELSLYTHSSRDFGSTRLI